MKQRNSVTIHTASVFLASMVLCPLEAAPRLDILAHTKDQLRLGWHTQSVVPPRDGSVTLIPSYQLESSSDCQTWQSASAATDPALDALEQDVERTVALAGSTLFYRLRTELDLTGFDLSGKSLANAQMAGAKLERAALRGADLQGSILTAILASGADFTGADLSRADLDGADLKSANLRDVRLLGARLRNAHLEQADLTGVTLRGVILEKTTLPNGVVRNDEEIAELIALSLSGELLPPAELVAKVRGDLQAIYDLRPDLALLLPRFPQQPSIVVLGNSDISLLDQPDTVLQTLIAELGRPERHIGFGYQEWKFPKRCNAAVLAARLQQSPRYATAHPVGNMDGHRIEADATAGIYTFIRGFGDCPSGCTGHDYWRLEVSQETATLVWKQIESGQETFTPGNPQPPGIGL